MCHFHYWSKFDSSIPMIRSFDDGLRNAATILQSIFLERDQQHYPSCKYLFDLVSWKSVIYLKSLQSFKDVWKINSLKAIIMLMC